jgi:aspartate racemase
MRTPAIDALIADPASRLPFRIGIVGGMGPMAGVYLQQLIIEATPAGRDQDHFQAVCFTNPHVPERMRSLAEDGGRRYADAVRASALLLADAGCTHVVIPCNTAHARLAEIRRAVPVPVVDMIELGVREAISRHGAGARVGLLATEGTIGERVYERAAPDAHIEWLLPDGEDQRRVSGAILAVKVNEPARVAADLLGVARRLVERGAGVILVGCTELSMCLDALRPAGVPLVDPLRIVASRLVEIGLARRRGDGEPDPGHEPDEQPGDE